MTKYGFLSLEIKDEKVEEVRVFSKDEITDTIKNFKEIYHINPDDDYSFFLTFKSKMNKPYGADISQRNNTTRKTNKVL